MPEYIAGCTVLTNAAGGISFHHGESGDAISFSSWDVGELATFLLEKLPACSENFALMMGGPLHGEFHAVDSTSPVIYCASYDPVKFTQIDGNLDQDLKHVTHTYTRQSDILVYGRSLPFVIYEHSSLCDENIKRKVKRLNEKIEKYNGLMSIEREDIARAQKAVSSAELRLKKTYQKYCNVFDERTDLSEQYGV